MEWYGNNYFTSHDDFIRFLIYSNLKKSYVYVHIYFISIRRVWWDLFLVRSIVNQSLVVKEQRNQFNFNKEKWVRERKNCERSWLKSNYKADRDHLRFDIIYEMKCEVGEKMLLANVSLKEECAILDFWYKLIKQKLRRFLNFLSLRSSKKRTTLKIKRHSQIPLVSILNN